MQPLKEKLSITIDPDVRKMIDVLAGYDGRSVSSYINMVLKRHSESMKKKHPELFKDMEDA